MNSYKKDHVIVIWILSTPRVIPFLGGLGLLGSILLLDAVAPASRGLGQVDSRTAAVPYGPVDGGLRVSSSCEMDGGARIEAVFARWTDLLRNREALPLTDYERGAEEILAEIFAIDGMSAEILGSRWGSVQEYERQQFRDSLVRALRNVFLPYFESQRELPTLRPAAEEWAVVGGSVLVRYWLVTSEWSEWFTLRLSGIDGSCKIFDVWKGDRAVLGSLRNRVNRELDDYSFPYMIAELGEYDSVILEDFEDDEEGSIPYGWTWRDQDKDKNKPYRVRVESGNHYLEATDEGESVILGKDIRWNLGDFPYISFRVRIIRIPEGGDERDDRRVDSAAGVYITLKKKFFGRIPESVKYVWSSTLPVGAAVRRRGIGRPWQVVFGSGEEGLGEWRTYVFDLREAYEDTFGGDSPSRSVGIGVLSDANSLDSQQAYADYDDIRALRTAPEGVSSGVFEIMAPLRSR